MAEQDVQNVHLSMDRARSMAHTESRGSTFKCDCQLPAHSRRELAKEVIHERTRESGGPPGGRVAVTAPAPRAGRARPRTVRFGLTEAEFAELEQAAGRAGLARGAYAAEAALAAARGTATAPDASFQDALAELIRAAGLVRRIGVNLNQAVAKLNATGQFPGDLLPYAQACMRRAEHLDAVAEQLRKTLR